MFTKEARTCTLILPGRDNETIHLVPRQTTIDEISPEYTRALILLRDLAEQRAIKYPQYKGHCADWVLGVTKRDLTFKGGTTVGNGELVLVKPQSKLGAYLNKWETTIYSPQADCDLGVVTYDITIL